MQGDYIFEGTTLTKLDEKGRLSLPKDFRELIDSEIVVTRHPDGCLVAYIKSTWEKKKEKLAELTYSERFLVRLVLGSATRIKPDKVGRVLIPSSLRELAQLEREATVIGLGDHFEIWNKEILREKEQAALAVGIDASTFAF